MRHGPLLADVAVCQIYEFVEGVIIGVHALGLGNLAHLAVISLDDVGRVDDAADGSVN